MSVFSTSSPSSTVGFGWSLLIIACGSPSLDGDSSVDCKSASEFIVSPNIFSAHHGFGLSASDVTLFRSRSPLWSSLIMYAKSTYLFFSKLLLLNPFLTSSRRKSRQTIFSSPAYVESDNVDIVERFRSSDLAWVAIVKISLRIFSNFPFNSAKPPSILVSTRSIA